MERHRLLWQYLKERTDFFTQDLRVLYVAPMYFLQQKFKKMENLEYISADISSPIAMVKMDITDIQFPDNHFDSIICNHVLEHVSDDRKALKEIIRVLRPGGWSILQVPIDPNREKTFEDSTITSPEGRDAAFGQHDHLRIYGRDYKDILETAGFIVKLDNYVKEFPDDIIQKYRLAKDETIYFCVKALKND